MSMNERGLQFNDDDNVSFYVSDFCRGFKKYWYIFAIISVVFCVFSVINCYRSYVPKYKAEVTFTVSTQERASSINGISEYNFYYDASTASHLSATFPGILSSKFLQERILSQGPATAQRSTSTQLASIYLCTKNPKPSHKHKHR